MDDMYACVYERGRARIPTDIYVIAYIFKRRRVCFPRTMVNDDNDDDDGRIRRRNDKKKNSQTILNCAPKWPPLDFSYGVDYKMEYKYLIYMCVYAKQIYRNEIDEKTFGSQTVV